MSYIIILKLALFVTYKNTTTKTRHSPN